MAELTEAEHSKVTEWRPLDNQNRHSNVQGWTLTVLKRRSHTLKKGHFSPLQNYKFDFRRKTGDERVKGDTDHSNKHIQQQSTKSIYWLQNAKKSDQEPYIQSNRSSRNHSNKVTNDDPRSSKDLIILCIPFKTEENYTFNFSMICIQSGFIIWSLKG